MITSNIKMVTCMLFIYSKFCAIGHILKIFAGIVQAPCSFIHRLLNC